MRKVGLVLAVLALMALLLAGVTLLIVEYIWWFDPVNGLAGTPAVFEAQGIYPNIMFLLTFGVLVTGALWYVGARIVQARRGVRIDRAFAAITATSWFTVTTSVAVQPFGAVTVSV